MEILVSIMHYYNNGGSKSVQFQSGEELVLRTSAAKTTDKHMDVKPSTFGRSVIFANQ